MIDESDIGDILRMLVPVRYVKNEDISNQNDQNRHRNFV